MYGYVFCGRGLHLRSTWCGSRVHCRTPVFVRTVAQTCRNLWWFHADAVPGHVVDMPVIVLTVVQMCRKLWKRFTVAVPGRCCW